MSWRERNERSRWNDGHGRGRSPVWELRRSRSVSPERSRSPRDRHRDRRDRQDRQDRHERYDHDRDRDRRDRDRLDRDRDSDRRRDRYDKSRDRDRIRERRRSSPRHVDDKDIPNPPSPPSISGDIDRAAKSVVSSRSASREREPPQETKYDNREKNEEQPNVTPGDWFCKCGSYNFKRRQLCYRRNCNGKRSEGTVYGTDSDRAGMSDGKVGITKRLLFRRLDALTTEENILDAIKERCSKSILDTIAGITIGRETLTGASKCLAYINFNSIADSTAAHTELLALHPPLKIDGREVLISFYNEPQKLPKPMPQNQDYNAYYAQMANYSVSSQALSEADRVNAAAAVAQSAISAAQARQITWTPATAPVFTPVTAQPTPTVALPTGDGKTVYTAPDVRTFLYDESSGYYYDPATGLYYDGNTQYFYNSQINKYMYWDANTSTYIAAAQNQNGDQTAQAAQNASTEVKEPEEKKKKDKEDKVKVAKKIAKDMERWARTLNQKKENAKSNIVMEQVLDTGASKGSADIGFSVLGAGPSLSHIREISPPPVSTEDFLIKKVEPVVFDNDEGIIDWTKLTCLLCKRRFPSVDVLTKHKTMSDLHKQNLAEFRKKNELLPQINGYRDRAAERRLKFGEDEVPVRKRYDPPETLSQTYSNPPPSVVDTIGGKMLQKMGWSEGRGLGKEEQGRIAPIEAEQRPSLVGLGQKRGIYTPTPGLTYRDTVKKLMIARYKEVVGQEDGN